jgi:hypothetical protein
VRLHRGHEALIEAGQRVVAAALADGVYVGPRYERAVAGPGEDERLHARGGHRRKGRVQLLHRLAVEGVVHLRPRDDHHGQAVLEGDDQVAIGAVRHRG